KFQISQDGEESTDIPEAVSLSDSTTANTDYTNGILTLSGGEVEQWETKIQNLPMFSNSGILHFYNIEEIPSENNLNTSVAYISKKSISEPITNGKEQSYKFNYENTITGTVSHIAYKYWKDVSVSPDSRPDIYFKLYRYLKNDKDNNPNTTIEELTSFEEYLDYKGQVWTKESENTGVDYENGYNWKITIDDLPEFDENGNQYVYLFTETINNNGVTVFGTYTQQSETRATENNEDTYEVFTNTINDYMTVKGLKTWTGLTGYSLKKEDLPDPEFYLYRTTDSKITDIQNLSDDEINNLVDSGIITFVDKTTLENKTKYSFPSTDAEEKTGFIERVNGVLMLPKFDSEGRRYNYLVRETFTGNNIVDQLYIKNNQNGTISNVFRKDLNRRSITVTKNWAGRESIISENEKQYPSVTYTLYRYELNNEENTKVQIESHKINSQDFASGSAEYTFENLLIYSPNGTQYCYYIVEDKIDGYSTQYNDGGITPDNRIDITDVPDTWNTDSKNNSDVSTLNTYDQKGNIKLSGEKIWNDYGNYENLRPSTITVTLKRHTASESGQNNAVNQTVVDLIVKDAVDPNETKPYIVWNKGENALTSDKWTYTIYNLERYAPNGMPYVYTLSEEQLTGYKKANDVSKTADSDTEITMSEMENSFSGSYYVRKNWMDGYNKYNLRPTSITVKLQRSTDGGATWNDIIYNESMGNKLPHVLKNSENKGIVSVTLDINNLIQN
ncbi:MAG: Cna B-type domain-containing protein, partial [Ruminococcus sp.]